MTKNSDLSTTYLGRVDKRDQHKLKVEESFPISEHGYTSGKLLDGTECQLLLDRGASPSCENHFICSVVHSTLYQNLLQKHKRYKLKMVNVFSVLFIIPVIIDIHGHRFKIYTLVSEIHENVDLVLGIKNVFELEGVINSRDCILYTIVSSLCFLYTA